MQKFTRALTREIEIAGERLAVTLNEEGLMVRPVGSRRPPHHLSWAACLCAVAGRPATADPPGAEELEAGIQTLKAGAPKEKAPAPASAPPPAEASAPTTPSHALSTADAPPAGKSEASLAALLARIDGWLATHRPRFHKGLQPPATDADLAALQEALGAAVPQELATLLRWHNGQDPSVRGGFERDWTLLSAAEIAQTKRDLGANSTAGWQVGWLPIADNNADSYLVLDAKVPSSPLRALWHGKPDPQVVASSLTAWLHDFDAALEAGKYHEDAERGTFLREPG